MTEPIDTAPDTVRRSDQHLVGGPPAEIFEAPTGQDTASNYSIAPPWYCAEDLETGETYQVFLPDTVVGVPSDAQALNAAFDPALNHRINAVHEAGHVIALSSVGIPIERSVLYSTREAASDGRGRAGGHTYPGQPKWPVTVGDYGVGLVSGRVASLMWLADEGQLSDIRRLAVELMAAGDYADLLAMDTRTPHFFLFGPAVVPGGWTGSVTYVDDLIARAEPVLRMQWPQVLAVADHLEQHGSAEAAEIDRLLSRLS